MLKREGFSWCGNIMGFEIQFTSVLPLPLKFIEVYIQAIPILLMCLTGLYMNFSRAVNVHS